MNLRIFTILAAIAALCHFSIVKAQEHAASPMINTQQNSATITPSTSTIPSIYTNYERAGKPRIAIFWNRQFSDQLSEWESRTRNYAEGELVERWQRNSSEKNSGSGAYRAAGTSAQQSRRADNSRGSRPTGEFGFTSAFSQTLLAHSIRLVDRQSIARLADRQQSANIGGNITHNDYQKIETESLLGFADYLAEVIFVPNSQASLKKSFQVTVKSVTTGELITLFESSGKPPYQQPPRKQYKATASGFQEVTPKSTVAPEQAGKQVANELLHALNRHWQ